MEVFKIREVFQQLHYITQPHPSIGRAIIGLSASQLCQVQMNQYEREASIIHFLKCEHLPHIPICMLAQVHVREDDLFAFLIFAHRRYKIKCIYSLFVCLFVCLFVAGGGRACRW